VEVAVPDGNVHPSANKCCYYFNEWRINQLLAGESDEKIIQTGLAFLGLLTFQFQKVKRDTISFL